MSIGQQVSTFVRDLVTAPRASVGSVVGQARRLHLANPYYPADKRTMPSLPGTPNINTPPWMSPRKPFSPGNPTEGTSGGLLSR